MKNSAGAFALTLLFTSGKRIIAINQNFVKSSIERPKQQIAMYNNVNLLQNLQQNSEASWLCWTL
jgi:hypothetical protein